ncbi:unnamed protein product, partial [Cladocopium goreaui]
ADRADLLDGFVHGHQHGERLPNASSAAIDTHLAIRHKRLPQRSSTLNWAVLKDAAGAYREKSGAARWKLLG